MGQTSLCGIKKKNSLVKSLSDLSISAALEFMVELRNVSIITPLETYFFILTFGNYPGKLIGEMTKNQLSTRKEELKFKYKTSFEDLRHQFILVQLLDNSKGPKVIARQRIPLSEVVTGPMNYDYQLEPPVHRVLFEVAMSQIVDICFNATEMFFELDELPDKRVCQPSLRLMVK